MEEVKIKTKLTILCFNVTFLLSFIYYLIYSLFNLKEHSSATIIITTIFLLIIIGFFIYTVEKMILRPIRMLIESGQRVNKGNLNEFINWSKKDEIGDLYKIFNDIKESKKELIQKIDQNAEQVIKSSDELILAIIENKDINKEMLQNTKLVSQGANAQINGIDEVQCSIEEMIVGVERINDTNSVITENSIQTTNEARKGKTSLEKIAYQMNQINKNSKESFHTIQTLGEKTKQIRNIVDVIGNISSRTNLLALNATIEAAREEEHGEGFVVIAEQIKDLAERTTESTLKIGKIAWEILEETERAIERIEKGERGVHSGIEMLAETSKAFEKIVKSAEEVSSQLNEVSTASEQLSINTKQIVDNIGNTIEIAEDFSKNTSNVAIFIQQQTNSVSKLSDSVQHLNEMSKELKEYIKKYNY